jgi:hypothetical protein
MRGTCCSSLAERLLDRNSIITGLPTHSPHYALHPGVLHKKREYRKRNPSTAAIVASRKSGMLIEFHHRTATSVALDLWRPTPLRMTNEAPKSNVFVRISRKIPPSCAGYSFFACDSPLVSGGSCLRSASRDSFLARIIYGQARVRRRVRHTSPKRKRG